MDLAQDTKTRITIAARELFFKYGIKSITMDDVAKHLGMSKKTVYQYFSDKDAIIENLMNLYLAEHQLNFERFSREAKNPIEEILEMMKHLGVMFESINPIIFYELQKYHPSAWKLFTDFKENCALKGISENLQRGVDQGLYRKSVNPHVMSRLRMAQVEWAMNPDAVPAGTITIAHLQLTLLEHFLHGICTIKGHRLINKLNEVIEEE